MTSVRTAAGSTRSSSAARRAAVSWARSRLRTASLAAISSRPSTWAAMLTRRSISGPISSCRACAHRGIALVPTPRRTDPRPRSARGSGFGENRVRVLRLPAGPAPRPSGASPRCCAEGDSRVPRPVVRDEIGSSRGPLVIGSPPAASSRGRTTGSRPRATRSASNPTRGSRTERSSFSGALSPTRRSSGSEALGWLQVQQARTGSGSRSTR